MDEKYICARCGVTVHRVKEGWSTEWPAVDSKDDENSDCWPHLPQRVL